MFGAYLRFALFIAGLIGAVILFAFAFTAAAVVVFIAFVILGLIGRPTRMNWWVVRSPPSSQRPNDPAHKEPLTIDHDPNDLPGQR